MITYSPGNPSYGGDTHFPLPFLLSTSPSLPLPQLSCDRVTPFCLPLLLTCFVHLFSSSLQCFSSLSPVYFALYSVAVLSVTQISLKWWHFVTPVIIQLIPAWSFPVYLHISGWLKWVIEEKELHKAEITRTLTSTTSTSYHICRSLAFHWNGWGKSGVFTRTAFIHSCIQPGLGSYKIHVLSI